jgi:quinol monooxygenase YgiN
MKLFVFASFHARDARESELESALTAVSAATRAEPDCLGHQVFQSSTNPRLFFIHSRSANEIAFDRHIALAHTRRFVEHVESLIDHELEVTRTRLIEN